MTAQPTPIEVATNLVLGAVSRPGPARAAGVRERLDELMLGALQRTPCCIAFSGGVDSSAVLALAVQVAREHGLDDPVPVTMRYEHPDTVETEWQERMVAELGLRSWEIVRPGTELNLLGPYARTAFDAFGLRFPPTAYHFLPVIERARGGTVVTGIDGDGAFEAWQSMRARDVLARRRRPEARDVLRIAKAAGPRRVRAWHMGRDPDLQVTWLRAEPRRAFARAWAEDRAAEPLHWAARSRWYGERHDLTRFLGTLADLGGLHDVRLVHPFSDRAFLAALGERGGRWGWHDRPAAIRAILADVTPEWILERKDKAEFSDPTWGGEAAEFRRAWTGGGVDGGLVDLDRLRAEWSADAPHVGTAFLLQAAYLGQAAGASSSSQTSSSTSQR